MKRILSFAIILLFVFSLAACKQQTAAIDPTEIPTRPTEAATEVPTEAPTEVPTETPTEAATPAPTVTPTPEPTVKPTPVPPVLPSEGPDGRICISADAEVAADLPEEAVYTVLFSKAFGNGKDDIDCDPYGETDGPNDFFFEKGKLVILDTMNRLVRVYEGDVLVRSIDVSEVQYPFSMERFGDSLYVYNTFMNDYICEYDWETGSFIRSFSPPEGIEAGYSEDALYVKDGKLCLMQGPGKFRNVLDSDDPEIREIEVEQIYSPENDEPGCPDYYSYTTGSGGGMIYMGIAGSCCYLGYDDAGNAYFMVGYWIPDTYCITWEMTIQKYSPDGRLIGVSGRDYRFCDHLPTRYLRITGDGRIFEMSCRDGELTVSEIVLGRVYYLRTDEIREWRNEHALSGNG